MDVVTKGFLLFGAALGYIGGIAIPPIVHFSQKNRLNASEFILQSMIPFFVGILLFFLLLAPVVLSTPDDVVRNPLLGGGLAIISIATACMTILYVRTRGLRMAN